MIDEFEKEDLIENIENIRVEYFNLPQIGRREFLFDLEQELNFEIGEELTEKIIKSIFNIPEAFKIEECIEELNSLLIDINILFDIFPILETLITYYK